jgi:hypothetical protein
MYILKQEVARCGGEDNSKKRKVSAKATDISLLKVAGRVIERQLEISLLLNCSAQFCWLSHMYILALYKMPPFSHIHLLTLPDFGEQCVYIMIYYI